MYLHAEASQPPVQPSQLPAQSPSQLPEHVLLQLQLDLPDLPELLVVEGLSSPHDVKIDDAKRLIPKMGRVPLAAFLKNSLRDWSPSSFSFFFITLEVSKLPPAPKFGVNNMLRSGNEKDVGVYSSAPIPKFRPSHCPFPRISNASQPTPRDYMYNHNLTNIIRYSWDIIYPRRRFVALLLWKESKLRSLNLQIVTF